VVKRETIKTYAITTPASIMDLGLRHAEQISVVLEINNGYLTPLLVEGLPLFRSLLESRHA
jgi:hypothetical protein